jgi:hypothetical protein
VRDYEIRQGESGQDNRPEDQKIFHGQWFAHDEFEWGEILEWREPADALERRPQLLSIIHEHEAGICLNGDGGGPESARGRPVFRAFQASEKAYYNFALPVTDLAGQER